MQNATFVVTFWFLIHFDPFLSAHDTLWYAEMNGHGLDFGHEFVSKSVSVYEADSDTDILRTRVSAQLWIRVSDGMILNYLFIRMVGMGFDRIVR